MTWNQNSSQNRFSYDCQMNRHARKRTLDVFSQRRFRSACAFAQKCSFFMRKRRLWSDCADAQADMCRHWTYISEGSFAHVTVQIVFAFSLRFFLFWKRNKMFLLFCPVYFSCFHFLCYWLLCSKVQSLCQVCLRDYSVQVLNVASKSSMINCLTSIHLFLLRSGVIAWCAHFKSLPIMSLSKIRLYISYQRPAL